MKLSTGVDLLEIERLQESIDNHGERFLKRIYTNRELSQVGDNAASLAARFAAKEAVAKTLGTGIGEVSWQDIEVLHGSEHEPVLHLHGMAQQYSQSLGFETWSISLSHTATLAIAMVVAMGE